jgi:hypothetical protein
MIIFLQLVCLLSSYRGNGEGTCITARVRWYMGQGLHTKGCGLMDIHKVTIHVSCCPIIIIIVETCRLIADNTSKRTSQIILEQGNTFSITLKCIDANNDFVAIGNYYYLLVITLT